MADYEQSVFLGILARMSQVFFGLSVLYLLRLIVELIKTRWMFVYLEPPVLIKHFISYEMCVISEAMELNLLGSNLFNLCYLRFLYYAEIFCATLESLKSLTLCLA